MVGVQKLSERDWANRRACCETILEAVAADTSILASDEAHFHLSGYSYSTTFVRLINTIFGTDPQPILNRSMSDLSTANVLLFGALSLISEL